MQDRSRGLTGAMRKGIFADTALTGWLSNANLNRRAGRKCVALDVAGTILPELFSALFARSRLPRDARDAGRRRPWALAFAEIAAPRSCSTLRRRDPPLCRVRAIGGS
jgi:hypothetical protein